MSLPPPPEKLSDLIKLAIADARQLDGDTYLPFHTIWHKPLTSGPNAGKCAICLAGAVIAGTLRQPPRKTIYPSERAQSGDEKWRQALLALDHAREGQWIGAIQRMTGTIALSALAEGKLRNIPPPDERGFHDWKSFNNHLRSLADRARRLRAIGF